MVSIPMFGKINSLNASAAAAVLLLQSAVMAVMAEAEVLG